MKYAKIIDSVVVQIQPNVESGFIEASDYVSCGMIYENGEFITPQKQELTVEQIKEQNNLLVLSPRQARLILLQYGLLDDIEAMLSTDRTMQIWWEYSLDIKRGNEHIINAGIALKLTEEQLDMMFIEGSKL